MRISQAGKTLSTMSTYSTIGIELMLPQYRQTGTGSLVTFLPAHDQYPVWYFSYSSLVDPGVLSRLLSPSKEPEIRPASTIGYWRRTQNLGWKIQSYRRYPAFLFQSC